MKRIAAFFMCLILSAAFFVLPSQAAEGLDKIDAPYMVNCNIKSDGTSERIVVGCAFTNEFAKLTGDEATMRKHGMSYAFSYVQLDYRIDGGEWQYTKEWDTKTEASVYGSALNAGETVKTLDLMYLTNETAIRDAGALAVKKDGKNLFDLKNHSIEIRLRSVLSGTVEAGNFIMHSEWTETLTVTRDVRQPEMPEKFEAPEISDVKLEYIQDTEMPYISFKVTAPESVKLAQIISTTYKDSSIIMKAFVNSGSGWQQMSFNSTGGYFSNETKKIYFNETDFEDEKLVKVKFSYTTYDENDNQLFSEETEEFRVTTPRWESGKGVLPAKCITCGICTPLFGKICLTVVIGIAVAVVVVGAIVLKIQLDKAAVRKAEAEEERRKKLEAERAAYNAKKQQNKQKNKK